MPCHGRRESQTIKFLCNRPSSSIPRTVHNRTSIVESFLEPRITQHFITTAQNVTWNPYFQHEIRFAGWKLEILDENPKSRFHGEGCPSTRTCVGCAVICYAVLCCAVLCRLCSENSATLSFLPPSPLPWWRSWFLRFDFRLRSYTSPTCGLSQVRLPKRTVRNLLPSSLRSSLPTPRFAMLPQRLATALPSIVAHSSHCRHRGPPPVLQQRTVGSAHRTIVKAKSGDMAHVLRSCSSVATTKTTVDVDGGEEPPTVVWTVYLSGTLAVVWPEGVVSWPTNAHSSISTPDLICCLSGRAWFFPSLASSSNVPF